MIPAIPQPLSQQFYAAINAMATGPNEPEWFRNPPTEPQPISREERVQGLATIWAEAKVSFAYWDRVPDLDWDAAFRAYIPKVEAADDPASYYDLLARFVAPLKESHTFVFPPIWLRKQLSLPPLGLRYLRHFGHADHLPRWHAGDRSRGGAGCGRGARHRRHCSREG